MPLSLKSIIQQAVLAASTPALLLGCSGGAPDTHFTVVVASPFPDGGAFPSSPSLAECVQLCRAGLCSNLKGCTQLGPSADGGVIIDCDQPPPPAGMCTGRRPEGLGEARARGSEVGRYLAASAYLEAASVVAFQRLASELRTHGAPAALVTRAQRSARDEVRHARTMSRAAREAGTTVPSVRTRAFIARSLEALALENAVEGCVLETYGAAVGAYQAGHASDAGIRVAMQEIAVDEAEHAQLAWDVAAWASAKLDRPAKQRIEDAQRQAIAVLGAEQFGSPGLRALVGLPGAAEASAMLRALEKVLWEVA